MANQRAQNAESEAPMDEDDEDDDSAPETEIAPELLEEKKKFVHAWIREARRLARKNHQQMIIWPSVLIAADDVLASKQQEIDDLRAYSTPTSTEAFGIEAQSDPFAKETLVRSMTGISHETYLNLPVSVVQTIVGLSQMGTR